MSLEGLFDLITPAQSYKETLGALKDAAVASLLLPDNAKPYVLSSLWRDLKKPCLVVCPRTEDARVLYEAIVAYCGDDAPVYLFPLVEVLPYERLVLDPGTVHARLRVLAVLSGLLKTTCPPLVIASAQGLMQKTLMPSVLNDLSHILRVGQCVRLEPLLQQWISMGYEQQPSVEISGSFSRRGGIVDVFPPGLSLPARIDLCGDVIESIRLFDPYTQRSQESIETVTVLPAHEVLPSLGDRNTLDECIRLLDFSNCSEATRDRMQEELALMMSGLGFNEEGYYIGFFNDATLLDYFSEGLLVLNEEKEIDVIALDVEKRIDDLRRAKTERSELPGNFPSAYQTWENISPLLRRHMPRCHLSRWGVANSPDGLQFGPAPSYWGRIEVFVQAVRDMQSQGQHVIVASRHARRLVDLLAEHDIGARLAEVKEVPDSGVVTITPVTLLGGWTLLVGGTSITLLTDNDLFGTVKRRATRPRRQVPRQAFQSELRPGTFVVHVDHGIGKLIGTSIVVQDGSRREYLLVEYAAGDRLYVPTEQLDRLAPYVSPSDTPPSLTRLGTQEWEKAKDRVRNSARDLAAELLSLYAERELAEGIAFGEDTPWQREIEDTFLWVETPDQATAIAEVKLDMERTRPMDRLICGDVGYGKTEVAFRAAFKAVMDGYQVAILVPTTVLAQQHYVTFTERLRPYPVKVEVLSRFRSHSEQIDVVRRLKSGGVDIVIGTHRLLQSDVEFNRLGLVVIDEEHRFGVADKERLKGMRANVDLLTLTATPIPRTLHMAMSGVRDMSAMETPPEERLPIKTYVSEYSDDLVREAILREIDRGGQIYYLHNRVRSINRVSAELKELVPEATVAVAHGRMPETELEGVLQRFVAGEFNVLVCTTIIESGLDIPGVNTLIIDRADRLGLAQLYQLRGRIGRGTHQAYAYLCIPSGLRITETAQKRLQTILDATDLGAGFRIAMKDLEIRGAGNILGPEQSGQINAVGFDLYTRVLADAVEALRSERDAVPVQERELAKLEIQVELGIPAFIPAEYVSDTPTRLELYQRLVITRDVTEVQDQANEFRDRFGAPPVPVHNLLYVMRVKALCRDAHVESVKIQGQDLVLTLVDNSGGARIPLERALGHSVKVGHRQVRLPMHGQSVLWGQSLLEVLQCLATFRQALLESVEGG